MSRAVGACVAYAAVIVLLGHAWLGAAATSLPNGDPFSFADDARLHTWVIGWIAHALVHEPSRLLDAPIYAPLRGQLAGIEHMASTQLLAVPVAWATRNPVLAMNAAIFASYLFTALAMRALVLAYGLGEGVAWVTGLLFALGPFRVPANAQSLQYMAGHLALVAWALRRLRDEPSPRRTLWLALATAAAALSSYYMAPMVAVVATVVAVAEAARARPGRREFFVRAAVAASSAAVLVAVVSLPWLRRGATAAGVGGLEPIALDVLWVRATTFAPLVFGWPVLGLAGAGLVLGGWGGRGARQATALGLVVAVVGVVLVVQPEPLPEWIAASPLRYLRAQNRFFVIMGLGTALVTAAGLETVTRALGRGLRVGVLGLGAALVVATRGADLSGVRDVVRPLSVERDVYDAVARAVAGTSPRPLLELPLVDAASQQRGSLLPLGQLETDAMVGGLVHGAPLVTGHSAHPPAHWALVATLLRRLPQSLDDLVDVTDVGWVLLRPADYWKTPAQRNAIARAPGLTPVLDRDGWSLLRTARATRHPEWVASIAAGPRSGTTVLGIPLVPVTAPYARITLERDQPKEALPGHVVAFHFRVENAGDAPWPVTASPEAVDPPVVGVVASWLRDAKEERREVIPLVRDVLPGETVPASYVTTAPSEPGTYEVAFDVVQAGREAPFGREVEAARVPVAVVARGQVVVGCLGDLNTAAGWPTPERVRWCEYAARECPSIEGRTVRFVNQGIGGAVASAPFAEFEMQGALGAGAERVVLAFGTNDVTMQAKQPTALVTDLQALCTAAAPRPCWVATIPPTLLGTDPAPWNAAIRAAFPADRVVDFTTGVVAVPGDGKHLDDASQRLVAARVRAALGCGR